YESWWSFQPSWQNSTASIERSGGGWQILGDDRGYLVLFPESGDVPQFAVSPDHRRKGIGRALFSAASAIAGRPLRLLNIDDTDRGTSAFLERIGATPLITQLEMIRIGA